MNKDLIMHFRIMHKLVDVKTKVPGTGKIVTQKILKPFLGKRGPGNDSYGGVTVTGARLDHPLMGMTIRWGVSLCMMEDKYNIAKGIEDSFDHAHKNEYVTKDVSYENAKQIANVIAHKVWDAQAIESIMKHLFNWTNEALPVEGTYVTKKSPKKAKALEATKLARKAA